MSPKYLLRAFTSIVLAAVVAGCATDFKEDYYYGVWSEPTSKDSQSSWAPTQFYRFRLSGWSSFGSDTHYEAGWYNAHAVETLFGEVGADKATPVPQNGTQTLYTKIPALSGNFTDSSANASYTLQHVLLKPIGNSLPLQDIALNEITADEVTVKLQSTGALLSVVVKGNISVQMASNSNSVLPTSSLAFTITPDGQSGLFSYQHSTQPPTTETSNQTPTMYAQLRSLGGSFNIIANGNTTTGQFPFNYAQTTSDYHELDMQSGTAEILGGNSASANSGITVQNAMMIFTNPQTVRSSKGWYVRGSGAFDGNSTHVSALHFSTNRTLLGTPLEINPSGSNVTAFVVSDQPVENYDALFSNGAVAPSQLANHATRNSDGTYSLVLRNATIAYENTPDSKSPSLGVKQSAQTVQTLSSLVNFTLAATDGAGAKSATNPEVAPSDLTISIANGSFRPDATPDGIAFTLADAVTQATDAGQSVVVSDTFTRQVFIFGPEGRTDARKENRRFVIFMSSNPRELTSRIQNMAKSESTQVALANMLFGTQNLNATNKSNTVSQSLAQAKAEATGFQTLISGTSSATQNPAPADGINETTGGANSATSNNQTEAQMRGRIMQILNSLGQ